MKILVGLGNPGEKYEDNRHNVGQMLIDFLVDEVKSEKLKVKNFNSKFKIVKTSVFMNNSGEEVKKIIKNFKFQISNLIVVHDDLDIPLGKFKIQMGSGPKLHNGIASIEKALGAKDFWRVRIGIENRAPDSRISGEDYVLYDFAEEEKKILTDQIFPTILDRLSDIINL